MFGFSKKERYETNVTVVLHALLADIGTENNKGKYVPLVKEQYAYDWEDIIQDNLDLKNSPEFTAFIIAVLFYIDSINNIASAEHIDIMREIVLSGEDDYNDEKLDILFRIKMTCIVASRWDGKKMPADSFALGLRDIHRALFGDDERLDDSVNYFLGGGNRIANKIKAGK